MGFHVNGNHEAWQHLSHGMNILYWGMAMDKRLSVLLIAMLSSGLIFTSFACVSTVQAESSMTKLSIPEFTVTYADVSYDVPASTSIDPFTGKTIENPVYHVENRTVQFVINGETITFSNGHLYYIIRMKGSFSDDWSNVSRIRADSNSSVMTILFSSSGTQGELYYRDNSFYLPPAGQADFQVQAQVWGEVMAEKTLTNPFGGSIDTLFAASDWSNTQTITIGANSVEGPDPTEVSPDETSVPNQPLDAQSAVTESGLGWAEISLFIALGIIALLTVALIYTRKNKKESRD
jgi:hypothetical protein